MNEAMVQELSDAFQQLEADDGVRAVVLAGRGAAFCAGIDLAWMKRMAAAGTQARSREARRLTEMLYRLHTMSKPTVARVHGASYAGALGLICACDMAVAAQDAEFCLSEVKVGLAAASIMPYLVRSLGERQVRRYALSAEVFGAAEAYRIGLVHDLALPEQLDGTVNELLGHLVQGGPAAQALAKTLACSLAGVPITRATPSRSAERFAEVLGSREAREGVSALLEKRAPAWRAAPRAPRRRKAAP
jgi:methylglutaconyl-CoA hydratase